MTIRQLRPGEQPPPVEPRRYPNADGYIRLRWRVSPGQHVECYEHRFIAGARAGEQAHHRNEQKDDNRPENIELLSASGHTRLHNPERIDAAQAIALYESGLSTPRVAGLLHCDAASVYRLLVRHGVKPRSLRESQLMDLPVDLIVALHSAGVRSKRIAKALHVSTSVVDSRVRERGLTPHRRGRPSPAEIAAANVELARWGLSA